MAGRGPRPKDPDQRVRYGSDPLGVTKLELGPAPQPKLGVAPEDVGRWPKRTRDWWAMWGRSAQAGMMTELDWDFLADTAALHARYWQGDVKLAAELRLRVAKFGATIEDRARLRMVAAERAAPDALPPSGSARERYRGLKVLPGAVAGA